jgi:hypothetical protein
MSLAVLDSRPQHNSLSSSQLQDTLYVLHSLEATYMEDYKRRKAPVIRRGQFVLCFLSAGTAALLCGLLTAGAL